MLFWTTILITSNVFSNIKPALFHCCLSSLFSLFLLYFLLIPVIWMSMHFQKQKQLEILRCLINQQKIMRPKILLLLSFLHSMRKQPFLWMEIIKEFYLAKRKKKNSLWQVRQKSWPACTPLNMEIFQIKLLFREGRLLLLKYGLVPEAVHNFYCPICSMH